MIAPLGTHFRKSAMLRNGCLYAVNRLGMANEGIESQRVRYHMAAGEHICPLPINNATEAYSSKLDSVSVNHRVPRDTGTEGDTCYKGSLSFGVFAASVFCASLLNGFSKPLKCELVDRETFINKKLGKERLPYKETESGLQYRDVNTGIGKEVELGDVVKVHYEGIYARSRTVVESTFRRGIWPVEFKVGENDKKIIEAIDEGVRGMRKGGVRELVVPPSLAYADITEVLIYEIHLLGIKTDEGSSYFEWFRSNAKELLRSINPWQ